jgi:O-antigen ligase
VTEAAYIAFLLLIYVGTSPFGLLGENADAASGGGDIMRQLCYVAVFAVIATFAAARLGWKAFGTIPVLLAVLLAWCLTSAAWSAQPDVTFRRAVFAVIVTASVFLSVETIGSARSLQLLLFVLAGLLIVNWLALPVIPAARHLADDPEPAVVGDWRGVFVHKNIAGAVCVYSAALFLHFARERRRLGYVLLLVAVAGFLVGTRSKSSIGLLPVAFLAGYAYRLGAQNVRNRQIVVVALGACLAVILTAAGAWWDTIVQTLQDPDAFTGRVAIWHAEIAFIADHPLLGSGFGSFSYTGGSSPIAAYVGARWVGDVANGHNGYLELLVTLGIPGFVLAMLATVIQPALWFARADAAGRVRSALLFTLFAFFLLHNFMEANFLKTDGAEWVTFLLVMAMLKSSRTAPETA